MLNFKEWLMSEGSNPGAKTGLYPLGYGGVGLYPPQWYLTRSADAIFYLSIDERIYKSKDSKRHLNNLDPKKYDFKSGESGLWDISHIKGNSIRPKQNSDMASNVGEKGQWDISKFR